MHKSRTALGRMEENIPGNKRPQVREEARKPHEQWTIKDFPPKVIFICHLQPIFKQSGEKGISSTLMSLDCLKTQGKNDSAHEADL